MISRFAKPDYGKDAPAAWSKPPSMKSAEDPNKKKSLHKHTLGLSAEEKKEDPKTGKK
jgi:hypothetical protein